MVRSLRPRETLQSPLRQWCRKSQTLTTLPKSKGQWMERKSELVIMQGNWTVDNDKWYIFHMQSVQWSQLHARTGFLAKWIAPSGVEACHLPWTTSSLLASFYNSTANSRECKLRKLPVKLENNRAPMCGCWGNSCRSAIDYILLWYELLLECELMYCRIC